MKLLLMEDELHLRQNIKKYLQLKGHSVDDFENGELLLDDANPCDYDCMILDINTPEIDGFELLTYVRENNITTPALFISALTDVKKVLKAFELGAQDYLKKPFDLEELEVRITRLNPTPMGNSLMQLDALFSYDCETRTLYKEQNPCKLSAIQKKLLYQLMKNRNQLVLFEDIQSYVWEDKEISHSTILSTVRDLKKLLPPNLLENIKGEGYRITL